MRKIKLSIASSLDNYVARLDGSFDWILMDQDYGLKSFFATVDTVLMGRKMYDLISEIGMPAYKGMTNYVFSRTKSGMSQDGVHFVSESKHEFIQKLRQTAGKDIWLAGGGELISSFLQAELVDQITLGVQPVLLGEGIPLFARNFPQVNLRLTECKSYPTGVVVLNYDVLH